MSFSIEFDYRFDTAGFFDDPERRAALETAAQLWSAAIRDDFETVAAGSVVFIRHPATGQLVEAVLDEPVDDLLIFAGGTDAAATGARVLATGGPATALVGSVLAARVVDGDGPGRAVTDFEPFAGQIAFDSSHDWALSAGVGTGPSLLSVAVHEIGHVLGIGASDTFFGHVENGVYRGPNALRLTGEARLALSRDGDHLAPGEGIASILVAGGGRQVAPQPLDFALLADIGYEVELPGLRLETLGTPLAAATGSADDIAANFGGTRLNTLGGDDTIRSGAGDDLFLAGAGNDRIDGSHGRDLYAGGAGADRIGLGEGIALAFGGAGDDLLSADSFGRLTGGHDTLVGGRGNDVLEAGRDGAAFWFGPAFGAGFGHDRIARFGEASVIVLDPALGFASAAQAAAELAHGNGFATLATPHGRIDIVSPAPLDAGDFRIAEVWSDVLGGTSGNDRLDGGFALDGAGRALVLGLDGEDTLSLPVPRLSVTFSGGDGRLDDWLPEDGLRLETGDASLLLQEVERVALADATFLLHGQNEAMEIAARLYEAAFDRLPDEAGLRFWTQALEHARHTSKIAAYFVESDEFAMLYGEAPSDEAFVRALYRNVLDRDPDPRGFAHWTGHLERDSLDRAQMLTYFAQSDENIAGSGPETEYGVWVL